MAEPSTGLGISDLVGDWFVAQCRPKHTCSVADALMNEWGVPAYVPLVLRDRVWGGRKRTVEVPLLPGYVFCCTDTDQQWYLLRRQPHVFGDLIIVKNRERFVKELSELAQDIAVNPRLGICEMPAVGTKVEVVRGLFLGRNGTVIGRGRKHTRIAIFVSEASFAYELEVESSDVEVVA